MLKERKVMKKYTLCFVVPYFGKLPSNIEIFLKTCEYNKNFNWLLFTDDKTKYQYPDNVLNVQCTFEQFVNKIQKKIKIPISVNTPKKLCDYKPAYGYICENELKRYDFWGYCDLDQMFGDLNKFIKDEILEKYDKLFCLGHMTIFRNNEKTNKLFMKEINDKTYLKTNYKQIFQDENNNVFDEWPDKIVNINVLAQIYNIPTYYESNMVDIVPFRSTFVDTQYSVEKQEWNIDNSRKNFIVLWEQGKIYICTKNRIGNISKVEVGYVHMQKRKIKLVNKCKKNTSCIIVIPNKYYCLEDINEDRINRMFFLIQIKSIFKIDELRKKKDDFFCL